MAINIIPKGRISTIKQPYFYVTWFVQNRLISFLIILFILLAVFYFGLIIYKASLDSSINSIAQEQQQLLAQRGLGKEKLVANFGDRAQQIKGLLANRQDLSNLFFLLEDSLHPNAVIRQASFQIRKEILSVQGDTDGYTTFAQQIILWTENPHIDKVHIVDFRTANTGRLAFTITLQISKSLFSLSL